MSLTATTPRCSARAGHPIQLIAAALNANASVSCGDPFRPPSNLRAFGWAVCNEQVTLYVCEVRSHSVCEHVERHDFNAVKRAVELS